MALRLSQVRSPDQAAGRIRLKASQRTLETRSRLLGCGVLGFQDLWRAGDGLEIGLEPCLRDQGRHDSAGDDGRLAPDPSSDASPPEADFGGCASPPLTDRPALARP